MSLIGQTLGQYRIIEPIGAGGMAAVYKAYQPGLDRYVAIKILPAQHALTPGFKERFMREARAVAQLSHPNILPIHDVGIEGDLSYFVMKYVPDHTLSRVMGQSMALKTASHYIDQVAGALDHAHQQGILHRDIKPDNMLLEGDWLLLADFGLTKIGAIMPLSTPGSVAGGTAMKAAMEIALEEINSAGGVLGQQVELIIIDTQGLPERGTVAMEHLINLEGVVAVVGEFHSEVGLTAKEVAAENNIPIVFAETWNDNITADQMVSKPPCPLALKPSGGTNILIWLLLWFRIKNLVKMQS